MGLSRPPPAERSGSRQLQGDISVNNEPDPGGGKSTILGHAVVSRLDRTFGLAAGVVLFVLMLVVAVDVVGRYLFSSPLRGSFEYVQICMALLVFLALPVVAARDENVQVEVFEALVPRRLRFFTRLLGFAISTMVVAGLVWVAFTRASSFHASGERFVLLPAPLYPVAYFIFAMWVICLALALVQFLKLPRHLRKTDHIQ